MPKSAQKAQTAIEYMILLAAVAIVVLVGYNYFFVKTNQNSEAFFNTAMNQLMDHPTPDRTFGTYP